MSALAWLHVAAAVLVLGPGAWTPVLVRAAQRDETALPLARAANTLSSIGFALAGVVGVWLVLAGDDADFGMLWIDGAGFLTFAGLVLATAGVRPALGRRRFREAFVASLVVDLFLVLALYLMVIRPE